MRLQINFLEFASSRHDGFAFSRHNEPRLRVVVFQIFCVAFIVTGILLFIVFLCYRGVKKPQKHDSPDIEAQNPDSPDTEAQKPDSPDTEAEGYICEPERTENACEITVGDGSVRCTWDIPIQGAPENTIDCRSACGNDTMQMHQRPPESTVEGSKGCGDRVLEASDREFHDSTNASSNICIECTPEIPDRGPRHVDRDAYHTPNLLYQEPRAVTGNSSDAHENHEPDSSIETPSESDSYEVSDSAPNDAEVTSGRYMSIGGHVRNSDLFAGAGPELRSKFIRAHTVSSFGDEEDDLVDGSKTPKKKSVAKRKLSRSHSDSASSPQSQPDAVQRLKSVP